MTENEAINELQANIDLPFGFTVSDEVSEIAIQALEEIQQYRAIGTIEEFKALKEHMKIIQEAYENTDGYKDGYAKAIDEFSERLKERIVGMQMAELQGEDICPCAENTKNVHI